MDALKNGWMATKITSRLMFSHVLIVFMGEDKQIALLAVRIIINSVHWRSDFNCIHGGPKNSVHMYPRRYCDTLERLATSTHLRPNKLEVGLTSHRSILPYKACIALFSLDQHHVVPVDTHVWKIATKYLLPELVGARLTLKLCSHVADAFVEKYGKYAGWAQTLLFIAELSSQKALLQSLSNETKEVAEDLNPKTACVKYSGDT